ncbi:MAG: hypothetical protein IT477_10600 [Rhodanobacteraceae bacterium]|nr:hypothetical protein [Rhodanobacteraceae bacterium]
MTTKRSGPSIADPQRLRPPKRLTLAPETHAGLATIAQRWGVSASVVVDRLVANALAEQEKFIYPVRTDGRTDGKKPKEKR